ncbi:MAG: hypothetical protein KME06_07690 [Kastovskya adunca ATA6-11-RM4]|jgi:hypothetical protein|nr:hypothetical protein [Kastovskya adunca ATA6-11-RM4]
MKRKVSILLATGALMLIPFMGAGILRANSNQRSPDSPVAEGNPSTLTLQSVHPDEPAEYTFDQRFALDNSLNNLKQVEGALSNFQSLTEKSKTALGEQAIASIENTDWESQNLGFPNWVGSVEGTLRKQDYQLKKLEWELAKKQFEDGEITQAVLDAKAANSQKAEQEFQAFWESFGVVD